jgi:predicted ATPase
LLGSLVSTFEQLTVKAYGAPGEVLAFWQENGHQLSLADVSDGILRLLCWLAVCLYPHPPALVAIDEPDAGIHPRAMSVLAGLFKQFAQRCQLLITTHQSYFLTCFALSDLAVLRKAAGASQFYKPSDSATIRALLADDYEDVNYLHYSEQLEDFA